MSFTGEIVKVRTLPKPRDIRELSLLEKWSSSRLNCGGSMRKSTVGSSLPSDSSSRTIL